MGEFEDIVAEIAEAGLLTEKQAAAYLALEVDASSRSQVAAYLDISPNTVDNHIRAARDKIEAAETTLETIDEYEQKRYPEPPDECYECGNQIGGMFVRDEDGAALCFDCADVEKDEFV